MFGLKLFYLRFSDFNQIKNLTSPVFAFCIPWILVLLFQELALCNILVMSRSSCYLLVLGNIFSSLFIYLLISMISSNKPRYKLAEIKIEESVVRITYLGLSLLFVLEVLQVFYSRGFPLLWLILGDNRTYIDFGIQSLNGFLNALYLLITTALFLICLTKKKKWSLFFFLLCLPIFLVCRQLMISLFLQISCCLLIYRPQSIKKIAIVCILVLAAFVVLGNIRTGLEALVKILEPALFIPSSLYSLLWIYAYIVTPFNNINAAIDKIDPIGMPYNELRLLLPSFLQMRFGLEGDNAGFELVHENMNVSTFYLPLIQDFGLIYAFCSMLFFQIIFTLCYRRVFRTGNFFDVIRYAIFYMIMILSIFSNLLLYLPVVFQLILLMIAQIFMGRKNGVLVLRLNGCS